MSWKETFGGKAHTVEMKRGTDVPGTFTALFPKPDGYTRWEVYIDGVLFDHYCCAPSKLAPRKAFDFIRTRWYGAAAQKLV